MEIFFAYARLLKREREKLRQKVQKTFPPGDASGTASLREPGTDLPECLRLSSVCQNWEH